MSIFIFSFSCSLLFSQFQHLTNQMQWYILYALPLSSIVTFHCPFLKVFILFTCFPLVCPSLLFHFLVTSCHIHTNIFGSTHYAHHHRAKQDTMKGHSGNSEQTGSEQELPKMSGLWPNRFCGMAFLDLSVNQGVCQSKHFLDHVFATDFVSNLILTVLWSLQIESGCGFHLLERPEEWVSYITSCWITLMQNFLGRHKITIIVADTWLIMKSQEHDQYLMDDFCALGIYDNGELYDLNLCQIYIQVTTLSDISDGPSKCISDEAFAANKLMDQYSTLWWPRQLTIMTKQHNLWKWALSAAYMSTRQTLKQPLGWWTDWPTQLWHNFYDPTSNQMVTNSVHFAEYIITASTRHHADACPAPTVSRYKSLQSINWISITPATVKPGVGNMISASYHQWQEPKWVVPMNPTNFKEYIKMLPQHIWQMLYHICTRRWMSSLGMLTEQQATQDRNWWVPSQGQQDNFFWMAINWEATKTGGMSRPCGWSSRISQSRQWGCQEIEQETSCHEHQWQGILSQWKFAHISPHHR